MKIKITKNGNDQFKLQRETTDIDNVTKLELVINEDLSFRIESEHGELRITKVNFDDCAILIKPCVSNQIIIK